MPIMSYINFWTVTIFLYLLTTGQSEMLKWLMLGERFAKDTVPPEIGLLSEESFFPVTMTKRFEIETKEERIITSVTVASMYMQGYVSVQNGGINRTRVEVLYTSEFSFPDILYVHVESAWKYPSSVKKNAA
uniref:Venom protein n=1 Tax=Ampulex compressa TaxID=860918 RepID=A0A1W6EVZ7_AMPCP|nr:venom protein [Ampulex compressa]